MSAFTKIIVRIIIALLTFVSTVFPNNQNLSYIRQQYEYELISMEQFSERNSEKWAPVIMEAIKEKDVKTIQSQMCQNIKDNTEDLPGEIRKLLDCIEGDIVSTEWVYRGGGADMKQRDGRVISQVGFDINIKTTVDDYSVGFMWETVNNFQPEETGIRLMDLIKDYEPYEKLYNISATEGIMVWHE